MNTTLLSRMIKELALSNDRITLPGLGVFVAEYVPASFSDKGYVINPPYRRLYFRARQGDDTLLQDMYVRINGTDSETAATMIAATVSDIRKQLDSKRTVELPGLGKLRATKENTLFFISEDGLDIYPEGFGMKPVSIRSIVGKEEALTDGQQQVRQDAAVQKPVPQEPAQTGRTPEQTQEQPDSGTGKGMRTALMIIIAAAAAAAALVIAARLCPEWALIDNLLYDKYELETVRWMRDSL